MQGETTGRDTMRSSESATPAGVSAEDRGDGEALMIQDLKKSVFPPVLARTPNLP